MKISVTSKLDGVRSWSLQALETCPGSIAAPGVLVDACAGCYATAGNYRFENVKAPRRHNKEDWQRIEWCDDMVQELAKDTHFRWFDSGDMYTLALAEKILEVMRRTPWVKHWLPTRMHKFPKFRQVLSEMQALSYHYRVQQARGDLEAFPRLQQLHKAARRPLCCHIASLVSVWIRSQIK